MLARFATNLGEKGEDLTALRPKAMSVEELACIESMEHIGVRSVLSVTV